MINKKIQNFSQSCREITENICMQNKCTFGCVEGQKQDNKRVQETAARGISERCNRTDTTMLHLQIITLCI